MNFAAEFILEYFAELSFAHSDFSLTPLLTNAFSLNHKKLYYSIYLYANSVLFCD